MALFVNTNVSALNGQKNLMDVTSRMNSSFEKLSSGSRINSAKDDAAGLQISDRLTTQITGLNQANRNANDGISIAQIAEGALSEVTTNVQRMRQLVVQGGNRTLSSDDRSALAQEFTKLLDTNNDIADRTAYGTTKILNGDSPEAGFQIQSGAQAGEQDTVTTGNAELAALFGKMGEGNATTMSDISANLNTAGEIGKVIQAYAVIAGESDLGAAADAVLGADREGTVADLGGDNAKGTVNVSALTEVLEGEVANSGEFAVYSDIGAALTVGTLAADIGTVVSTGFTDAQINTLHGFATDTLLDAMSGLVTQVDKQRAKLGAEQNGLTSMVRSNTAAVVNVSDSRSRIMDTDFASETSELTRNQIIQQASTTILSQANQLPQTALSLLR
ncbi:flagellin [Oceanospirillum maris]|uniref:flagellin N-terminal helical domain-containing protein n=1 Tax=Oceanospirillum maris TaxID=64977 RepID=UPI000405A6B7|nr:flagellin [Oceanospirillum maris]